MVIKLLFKVSVIPLSASLSTLFTYSNTASSADLVLTLLLELLFVGVLLVLVLFGLLWLVTLELLFVGLLLVELELLVFLFSFVFI